MFPLEEIPHNSISVRKFLDEETSQFQEVPFIVNLSVCATGVMVRKWSPVPIHSNIAPNFSSKRSIVAGFMLRSLIHLDLSFACGDR
ncbi:hypothetical protein H671_8g19281 [Cricetulus griseus]|nr:hypothetical protein H671_8g19281 [Cricetulus griseus]